MTVLAHDPADLGAPELQIPTLADLLANLGPGILDVVAAPRGLEVPVGEAVIFDPRDDVVTGRGDLLLAVGTEAGGPTARHLLDRVAGTASAVVFKGPRGDTAEWPSDVDVAVLRVAPEMSWGQLHALLRTARFTGDNPDAAMPVGDLFALANAVAAMVGGPTTIEDRNSVVLAYSNAQEPIDESRRETILGRRVPDRWVTRLREDGVFQRLAAAPDPVRIDYSADEEDVRPRLAIAVRAGGEILGSIWVAEGRRPLGPESEDALREAARLAALHLIRHRSSDDIERRRRAELLRSVLDGAPCHDTVFASLGLGPKSNLAVVAFEVEGDDPDAAVYGERALNLISLYCEAYRRRAATVARGGVVHAVFEVEGSGSLTGVVTELTQCIDDSLGVGVLVGIGSTVEGFRAVPESRWEADQVLRVLHERPEAGRVAHISTIRSHVVLRQLRDMAAVDSRLVAGPVTRLLEADAQRGTDYTAVLEAYLEAFGDVRRTAQVLHVHANTVRYRLRRLVELTGIDLDDPTERLVVQLQLALLREP